MATLRDIRRKIGSVKSTQQITKAMKMVAAAKLRKAQDRIAKVGPYADTLAGMLSNVAGKVDSSLNDYFQERPEQKVAYIVVAADRGLCGSYNANVLRRATQVMAESAAEGKDVSVIPIGKKSVQHFKKEKFNIVYEKSDFFSRLNFENALEISRCATGFFQDGTFDHIYLVFTHALSPVNQEVIVDTLLPVKPQELEDSQFKYDYIFEPNPVEILNQLCPKSINIKIWRALADSYYSEEGMRMVAMENATNNAQDLINGLTLTYNKARQAAITKEINEIVGGAEALK